MSRKGSPANKRIILYVLIGILAVSVVAVTTLRGGQTAKTPEQLAEEQKAQAIADNKVRFCGTDSKANSNAYIKEYVLPKDCELPLGMAVDGDRVWYLSTKHGTLGSYNLATGKFEEFEIPSWPARSNPDPGVFSMTWATKIDSNDNVWFTDDRQNLLWKFDSKTGEFSSFKSPASGPISFDFDSDGNIYLVGVRSNSLYFGNISEMKPGTVDGFKEIKLPLDAFSGIQFGVVSGSLVVDRQRNVVWTSVLAFDQKGQIYSYDIKANEVSVYDLPDDLNSPVGTTLDKEGNLWVTDHATDIFFMLNRETGKITKYSTSILSPKILGATPSSGAYTLPYWIQTDADGNLWFNQHVGNKINRFDLSTQTMTEYWIPTQNPMWANCAPSAKVCGVANALQISVGPTGQVWFPEWTENKIGTVSNADVPLTVSAPEEVTVNRGSSTEIKVDLKSESALDVSMVSAGTFTSTGTLGNSTGIFSQQSVSVDAGGSEQVSYVFTPDPGLAPGQYVLMLGADQGDFAVLKAVKVNIV